MNWYITTNGYAEARRQNAGSKAPDDVARICRRLHMSPLVFQPFPIPRDAPSELYMKLWLVTVGAVPWLNVGWKVRRGDIVLYQHPLYGNRLVNRIIPVLKKRKGCRFIALIHDLESLRRGIGTAYTKGKERTNDIADNVLLRQFDAVICHNSAMRDYLVGRGFDPRKVICLGVFDYLTPYAPERGVLSQVPSIAIAGNLNPQKSGYLYRIAYRKDELAVHLFGVEFHADMASENMNYHGSFEPEELPNHLTGDFGLVWDGDSTERCTGNTGEYLRYNNPHKISLYLASNMPVIVWSESALADYVCSNNFGFAVDAIDEIPERIRSLTAQDYLAMCEAVRREGEKLRGGYYTTQAIERAIQVVNTCV